MKETHGGAPLKLTIESGSNAMLRSLAKGFVADDVRAATRLCRRMKVPFSFTVLFGAEGETEATVAETLDLVAGEKPEYLSASIGVYVYPSTPLALRTRGRLWSTDEELLGQTLIPVERESIERQIEARLAGCGFPVYVH